MDTNNVFKPDTINNVINSDINLKNKSSNNNSTNNIIIDENIPKSINDPSIIRHKLKRQNASINLLKK